MSQTWQNADGLYVKFNGAAGTATTTGSYEDPANGALTVVEIKDLDLTLLGSTDGGTIIADNVVIPKSAWIEKVDVITVVAATSGGSAVLNLGLVREDRTTELDWNGILVAVPLADHDALNEQHTYTAVSSGNLGALCGAATSNPGLLTADYDTAAYTAGKITIRIFYRENANVSGSANA